MEKTGTLYMIPCPIVDFQVGSIPSDTLDRTKKISHFVVERARTARRWLSSIKHPVAIDDMSIYELDKNAPEQDLSQMLSHLQRGIDVGVLSEAGCPGIADPGHRAVQYAHSKGYRVAPLVGPNSILMALMASGFSGQSFAFHGYLPNKKPELVRRLQTLEGQMIRSGQTQLFMEAPYRNGFMIETACGVLQPRTLLSVACDLDADTEYVRTFTVQDWKSINVKPLHKRPAIFSIGKY